MGALRVVRPLAAALALVAAWVAAPAAAAQCVPPAAEYEPAGPAGSDPLTSAQWGLDQVKARAAWARGLRGQGVTVAVLDTGVDTTHPDLSANLWPGADLFARVACAQDDTGHGTAVAGVIVAAAGNGHGVAGVAPEARVLPLKVNEPGTTAIDGGAAIAALQLAAARRVHVVNMSFGGWSHSVVFEDELEPAIREAWKAGAVIVASAGNLALPLCSSPAIKQHVICVASTRRDGLPADGSQFPARTDGGVALRAPGGSTAGPGCEDWVMTTFDPRHPGACSTVPGYGTSAGTSFAAPHVAGVAALLASAGLTNEEIVERLRSRSSNGGVYDPVQGHGVVDADRATEGLAPRLAWPQEPAAAPAQTAPPPPPAASAHAPAPVEAACLAALRERTRTGRAVRSALRRLRAARGRETKRAARRLLVKRRASARRAARTAIRACR